MRKFLVLIAALSLAWCSSLRADSYLYWMVDDTATGVEFSFADLIVMDKGGNTFYLGQLTGEETTILADPQPGLKTSEWASLLPSDASDFKFFVEIFDAHNKQIGVSEAVTYQQLSQGGFIGSGQAVDPNHVWHFSAAVPEPSGALLSLIGFGLLALRRRREKV